METAKVQLPTGRVVDLTQAQMSALKAIVRDGSLRNHEGVQRATVTVLERHGLIHVKWWSKRTFRATANATALRKTRVLKA